MEANNTDRQPVFAGALKTPIGHLIHGLGLHEDFKMPLSFATKKNTQTLSRPFWRVLALALVSSFVPNISLAQDDGPVTLRFENGQGSLTGRLTAFRDDKWFMDTSVGQLVLPNEGITCVGDACPAGTTLDLANAKVALTSKDGSVTIDGDLIEILNDQYVLATPVGEQRIDVAMVDCAGAACDATTPSTQIAAEPESREVELSNGSINLIGELLGIEDDAFILKERTMGDIRVSMAEFNCTGAACP